MKSVTITIGDYDLEIIEQIFENEKKFKPNDPRDELMIELMRQVKDNPKVDLGDDEAAEYTKAKTRFSKDLGGDGKPIVKRQPVQLWTKFSEISAAAFCVFSCFWCIFLNYEWFLAKYVDFSIVNDIIVNMQTDIDFEYWDAQIKHFVSIFQSDDASRADKKEAKTHLTEIQSRLKRDVKDLNKYIKELESELWTNLV